MSQNHIGGFHRLTAGGKNVIFFKRFSVGRGYGGSSGEGNNTNSDFWAMEQTAHSMFKEPSEICVDHYNRYKEDIALLAGAELNAYRFSVEWARI
jgi:beta-glucosidase